MISRESSFLFNNLILLASCFAVLWGTLFPVISEAVTGDKISLDADLFNRLMVPIGLFLLFLTGVGPLFAWRRTSVESLRRNFQMPGHRVAGAGGRADRGRHAALLRADLVRLLPVRRAHDAHRVLQGRAAPSPPRTSMNLLRAMVELTHRNTRRYGGYLVHMGIVLMFIGFTGHAFNQNEVKEARHRRRDADRPLRPEDGGSAAGRERRITSGTAPSWQVSKNGDVLGTLEPEKRFYKASRQGTSPKSAIRAAAERRPVPELRRHVGRQPARRDSGVRVPAGLVDLDRRPGADRRHA